MPSFQSVTTKLLPLSVFENWFHRSWKINTGKRSDLRCKNRSVPLCILQWRVIKSPGSCLFQQPVRKSISAYCVWLRSAKCFLVSILLRYLKGYVTKETIVVFLWSNAIDCALVYVVNNYFVLSYACRLYHYFLKLPVKILSLRLVLPADLDRLSRYFRLRKKSRNNKLFFMFYIFFCIHS